MLKLNLLPPEEKNALMIEQSQRWIVFYGSAIAAILLIFAGLLGAIWLSINYQLKNAAAEFNSVQTSLKGRDLKSQEEQISQTNAFLKNLDNIQRGQKIYSDLLIALSDLVPPGAKLTSLTIDEKNAVALYGFAAQREQILAFKEALENSKLFKDIESPLSNLVKQTDINFYFNFNLQPDALNKKL